MGVFRQIVATGISSYLCMSMGLMFAWPSCTYTIFNSATTTLQRTMSETELALFGSLSSVGALISTPIAGALLDKWGRKNCMILSSLTHVVAWTMITTCTQVELILTAIFISGIGGAVFLVVPMYVSEICQESIRGAMTSFAMIFYAVGMMLSYLLGGYLQYDIMNYVCLTLSVFGVVILTPLRRTPTYLMAVGLENEAVETIAYYRHKKVDSKEVQQEIDTLRRAFNPDLDDEGECSPEEEKFKPIVEKLKSEEKLSTCQFIKKSKSTRQALFVIMVLGITSMFQGLIVVQVYAEPLFEEAVPNMSATMCSVLLAVVTVVVGFFAAWLTEVAGRRPLMIYSSLLTGLCCTVLGAQLHFHWGPHWVTALFMYLFCAAYSCGAGTVPFVLAPEVFLPEIKSYIQTFFIEWVWFCMFILLFIFNPLISAIGLGPVFYIFAAVSFFTVIFCIIYLPETKGLSVDAIQKVFIRKRRSDKY